MRYSLVLHPDSHDPPASGVEVEVVRPRPGALELRYLARGATAALRLPPSCPPERTDGLWRTTCFEAFLQAAGEQAYYEVNLSPSTQWAVYRFADYRTGMTPAREVTAPRIASAQDAEGYRLEAAIDLGWAPHLPGDAVWRLGLSAVLEDAAGRLTYWALAHPPGRPDFHAAEGRAAEAPFSPS